MLSAQIILFLVAICLAVLQVKKAIEKDLQNFIYITYLILLFSLVITIGFAVEMFADIVMARNAIISTVLWAILATCLVVESCMLACALKEKVKQGEKEVD